MQIALATSAKIALPNIFLKRQVVGAHERSKRSCNSMLHGLSLCLKYCPKSSFVLLLCVLFILLQVGHFVSKLNKVEPLPNSVVEDEEPNFYLVSLAHSFIVNAVEHADMCGHFRSVQQVVVLCMCGVIPMVIPSL